MDSLDAVEVVMAIEEEFAVEIPDEEADQITSVAQGTSTGNISTRLGRARRRMRGRDGVMERHGDVISACCGS